MGKRLLPQFSDKTRFMLSFMMVASTAGLGVGTAKVATSLYAVQLQASEFELGLIAAAQSIGILFMGLPTGVLINRFGPLLLFSLGSLLAGIWYGLIPAFEQAWFLILCTTLVSFCMPFRFVSLNTVFMSNLNQLGAAKAGWFRGTHMIGFMLLGPVLAVWLIEQFAFQGAFWIIGAVFMVPVMLAPLMFSNYTTDRKNAPKLSVQAIAQQLSLLKKDIALRYTSLIELSDSAAMAYFTFFIVVIAIKDYHFSPAVAASLVTLYGSVYMLSLFGMGMFLERLGEKKFYQIGFSLLAVALLGLALPLTAIWLWIGALLLGLGMGILNVVNLSAFARIGQRVGMANVSALSSTSGPLGSLLGSILGGWLGHTWGLQALFFPLALLFLGLIALVQYKHPFGQKAMTVSEPEIDILTNVDGQ